jgi:pimeloyl-ACP methyl ester carboxylesterase
MAQPAGDPAWPPLYVDCRGAASASPTVILEAGAFGTSADWDYILDDLSKGGRVCAYDRAGIGRSPDRPGDRGVLAKAGELNGLLDQLGETRPVILVGHSNGALYIEAFARLFPERVAGLLYVNGVNADAKDDPLLLSDLHTERELSNLAAVGARLGLAPLVAGKLTDDEHLSPAAAARKREALDCVRCLVVSRDEDRLIVPGLDAVERLDGEAVRHIPTVVISGSLYPKQRLAAAWRAAEVKPAAAADRSWILDAPGATHVSPLARDRAYIDAAVGWLRSLTTPPRSASTPTAPPE